MSTSAVWAERWTLASTVVFVFSRCYGLTALRPGTGLHSGLSGTGGSGVVSFVPAGWCAVEPGDGQAGRLSACYQWKRYGNQVFDAFHLHNLRIKMQSSIGNAIYFYNNA